MAKGKQKRPPTPSTVPKLKNPPTVSGLPGSSNSAERICWRFEHVDHDGPWGFREVSAEQLCHILEKLRDFEKMTVNELFRRGGEPGKSYEISGLPTREARERLDALRLADQTQISRLRLTGERRLYGFLDDENVFHVVFWDPEHEIWPSRKKHT